MSDELKRTVVSAPDAPILEIRIDLPGFLKDAIADSLERGKEAAKSPRSKGHEFGFVEADEAQKPFKGQIIRVKGKK
jgi:hypothetical protein